MPALSRGRGEIVGQTSRASFGRGRVAKHHLTLPCHDEFVVVAIMLPNGVVVSVLWILLFLVGSDRVHSDVPNL